MKRDTVHISEMRLRAAGLGSVEARALGEAVAKRLSELPARLKRSQTIPTLTLRVKGRGQQSVDRLADEISQVIKRSVS